MALYEIVLLSDNKEEVGIRRLVENYQRNPRNSQWCANIRKKLIASRKNPLKKLNNKKLQMAKRHLALCPSCVRWGIREGVLEEKDFFLLSKLV